jgi:hypothetical protein
MYMALDLYTVVLSCVLVEATACLSAGAGAAAVRLAFRYWGCPLDGDAVSTKARRSLFAL